MIDTGMNRLGLRAEEATGGALDGLTIETLLSHLASADEDSEQNARQLAAFREIRQTVPARRYSLENSAVICLGADSGFDLTRPRSEEQTSELQSPMLTWYAVFCSKQKPHNQ